MLLARPNLADDKGSAVTGFAVAAPMLIAVFLAIIALTSLVQLRAVLGAAASVGVRVASAYGASDFQGKEAATDVLLAHGLSPLRSQVTVTHLRSHGVGLVRITVKSQLSVPFLKREATLVQTAQAVDEGNL